MESSDQQMRSVADTRGKHRISAELKQLEQEARFLEEELEQVDRMEKASAVCKDVTSHQSHAKEVLSTFAPELQVLRTHSGIGGLKDQQMHLVAGAGYFDHSWLIRNFSIYWRVYSNREMKFQNPKLTSLPLVL
nr:guanine nucleotide-binding protein subunit gamma 2-like [Ipomoea batatas]